jgi:hypothetical protein
MESFKSVKRRGNAAEEREVKDDLSKVGRTNFT